MENDFTNSNVERVELKQSSIKDEKINSRQQDKIIAVVESQNYSLLNERTVDVSAEQRENFLKKIVSGEVIDKDFYTVVEKVGGPEPEESFNSIYNNVLETSILQNCVRDLFPVGGKLSLDVLEEFKKRYPTPYEFENVSKDILSFIEKKNIGEFTNDYENALRNLGETIYGKKLEYYKQIKLLKKEALRKEVFDLAEILGDEVPIVGKSLTKEILLEEDLIPKYFVELKDARVFLSDTYLIEGNRSGVVGYVMKDGKVTVNTFYKSNSQGIWRYLVGYKYDEQKVTQYNKGYAEESINLPFEVQFALSKIPAKRFPFKEENNCILVSVGTAKKIDNIENSIYYKSVSSTTVKLKGVSRGDEYRKKIAPENIVLTKEESPNFSNSIAKWNYSTPLLGKITAEVFDSNNGKLRYIFCRNEFGASWIANIEVNNSEITSTGLKKEWVYSPDLTTPPIERGQQTDVYFGEKISGTKYYDMYKNYLSKIPVIQEYEKYLAAK